MSLYRLYGPKVEVLDWRAQIERRAAEAQTEIHAMGNSARRSIGQVLRRAREAELARRGDRMLYRPHVMPPGLW